jgi:hypothetical protein
MKKFLLIISVLLGAITALQFQSCKKDSDDNNPMIQSLEVTAPSPNRVIFKGSVISAGKSPITGYGFIYNYSPTIDENTGTKVSLGTDAPKGEYTKEVNGLTFSGVNYQTVIYARAYLTNEQGTVFGKMISVNMPLISASSPSPQSGKVGDLITINGQFYITDPKQAEVSFNGIKATVTEASNTKIVAQVPAGITATHNTQIPLQITIGGQRINTSYSFTIQANIKDYSPKSGTVGTVITFTGDNMPNYYYADNIKVSFGQVEGVFNYGSSSLQAVIPAGVTTEQVPVSVTVNGKSYALPGTFTVTAPTITSISPTSGVAGTPFTVTGTNFPTSYGYGTYSIFTMGSINPYINSISSTTISASTPTTASTGEYTFTIKIGPHTVTAPQKFTVIPFSVNNFAPRSGSAGQEVNIYGNFLSGQYYDVAFGTVNTSGQATSANNLRVFVPGYIDAGKVKVTVKSNGVSVQAKDDFTVVGPSIDSFTPASGVAGSIVTIYGNGFGNNTYATSVKFGSIAATVLSVTDNSIRVTVPSNLNIGAMKISVVTNGQTVVSDSNFTATN